MCGIAGIHFKKGVSPEILDRCAAHFASNLHHRGPDAFGAYRNDRSVFANIRLAIVDRAGGDQPIYAPGGRQGIVYNGEVYNWQELRRPIEEKGYPFTTHTDTESVLAAYLADGEESFARLNGMFAFCIWDEEKDGFTLARDRFGMKPLYVYEDSQMLAFASEIKTILGLPGIDDTLNPLAFQDYLTYRYCLAPYTFFKNIKKLPAGCSLHYDGKGSSIRRFASISISEPESARRPEEYVEELDEILERAVRSQLMGEVPIGVLLSGGLDSSAIACYIQRAGAKLKAYNIGFPEINEFPYARDVAQKFDLEYVEICMTREDLVAGMDRTIIRLDEPMADPACFALSRLCEAIRQDVTVVLSGEGGDEMFAGYGQHLFALDSRLNREQGFAQFFHFSANFDDARTWLRNKSLPPEQFRYKASAFDPADTVLNGMLAFELSTWMPENLMMKADKVLMAHSLEGRFPFLDLDLYHFASRLPQEMKLPSPESSKHVLRTLMADKLPESVITRRKMGFTVPPAFFLQRLRTRFRVALDILKDQPVAEVLDLDAVARLMQSYYAGEQVPLFKIWNIFVLVFWFAYAYPLFRAGKNPLTAPGPAQAAALDELKKQASSLAEEGKREEALETLLEARGLAPEDATVHRNLGDNAMLSGNRGLALASHQQACLRTREPKEEVQRLADTLVRSGDAAEARLILTAAVQDFPEDPSLHLALAKLSLKLGDQQQAAALAQRALELNRQFAEAAQFLAELPAPVEKSANGTTFRPAGGNGAPAGVRLAVYTVLLGEKEPLGNPLAALPPDASTDLEIDFICFTDNRALTSPVWRFVYLDAPHLPAEKLSRRPKALPHEYLPDYEYSLYIDNTVDFKRLPRLADLKTDRPYLFRVFRHATRNSVGEEADAIASIGYDEVKTVCTQLDHYSSLRPLEGIAPLSTCTVILRSHHHPEIVRFGVTWWEQILAFSKRDQMSFDFSLQHSRCAVEYFKGSTHDNEFVRWPVGPAHNRVLASFDATRYAWLNRHDPEARRNPRAHFLANRTGDDSRYARPIHLFEYICHKQKSSLGAFVSPRRSVALSLGEALAPYRESTGRLLVLKVRGSDEPLGFHEEELGPACSALALMLSRHTTQVMDLSVADLRNPSLAYSNPAAPYDILVVLGLPPDCLDTLLEKFGKVINPARGLIAVVATASAELGAVQKIRDQLTSPQQGILAEVSVESSRHDDLKDSVKNSVICFQWR